MKIKTSRAVQKLICPEPEYNSKEDIRPQFIQTLNWYGANIDYRISKRYTLDYLKYVNSSKEVLKKYSEVGFEFFPLTIGAISRMIETQNWSGSIPTRELKTFEKNLKKIPDNWLPVIESDKKNIQKYDDKIDKIIAEINYHIDQFVLAESNYSYNFKEFFEERRLSNHISDKIKYHFEFELKLTEDILIDPEMKEAYSNWSIAFVKKMIQFYKDIIFNITSKSILEPVKSIVNLKKVSYCKEYAGIKSISCKKILGADQLLTFDITYNKFSIFKADSPKGLHISGTTLINFDKENSTQKKLKSSKNVKVEDFLKNILKTSSLKKVEKVFAAVNSKQYTPKGRLSKNILILKAF